MTTIKKIVLYGVVPIFLVTALVWASGSLQTINTLPSSNASFLTNLRTFLRDEDAQRYQKIFRSFVISGDVHPTGAGLTHTPSPLTAIINGYYVTESGNAITYPDNTSGCVVIADANLTGNNGGFTRVAGTHYLLDCAGAAIPANAIRLYGIVTSGGAVTIANNFAFATSAVGIAQGGTGISSYASGDLIVATGATTLDRIATVATGNAIISGGLFGFPTYGKIGLTTHVSGTLPCANGGTSTNGTPTNGQLLIGNGSCFTLASVTGGTGITVTPGAGSLTISTAGAIGLWASRALIANNNSGTPNTQYDLAASYLQLKSPSDNSLLVRNNPSTVTCNVLTAGSTANGRDQAGAFSADSWIHFYFIDDDSTLACLASASAPPTGPTLPSGYTHWAYAGAVRFNGSSVLVRTRIMGNRAFYEAEQVALSAGVATTETAVSVAGFIPPNTSSYSLALSRGDRFASTSFKLRYISGVDYYHRNATVGVNSPMEGNLDMPNVVQQFYYLWGTNPTVGITIAVSSYVVPNGAG